MQDLDEVGADGVDADGVQVDRTQPESTFRYRQTQRRKSRKRRKRRKRRTTKEQGQGFPPGRTGPVDGRIRLPPPGFQPMVVQGSSEGPKSVAQAAEAA